MAEVLVKFDQPITSSDGRRYFPQAAARERDDGLWEGWIEFVALDETGVAMSSERETTQPNRSDVHYWAQGLTTVYLQGALERALTLTQSVPRRDGVDDPSVGRVSTKELPNPS